MQYQTIKVRFQDAICFIQLHRPDANNTINSALIDECRAVLERCKSTATVVVIEGSPDVFCLGADFGSVAVTSPAEDRRENIQERLYELWKDLADGPYVSIAHVRGKANAGGLGFIASSDIVIADTTAQFSLSELLFGLFPACVLPFLIKRIGIQRAHYLTLMTQSVSVQQAHAWGLVDVYEAQSQAPLRRHLLRLHRLSKKKIGSYKKYMRQLNDSIAQSKAIAIDANREMFADPENIEGIRHFIATGQLPLEAIHHD